MATRRGADNWLTLGDAYRVALEDGRLDAYRKRRWRRAEEFSVWLAETALPSLSEKQAADLYRASASNQAGEFKANTIEDVRETLDFLLLRRHQAGRTFPGVRGRGRGVQAGGRREAVRLLYHVPAATPTCSRCGRPMRKGCCGWRACIIPDSRGETWAWATWTCWRRSNRRARPAGPAGLPRRGRIRLRGDAARRREPGRSPLESNRRI